MSAVLNERLLRKFCFALLEDTYGDDLAGGYGSPVDLSFTFNVGRSVDVEKFAADVVDKVVIPAQSR